MQHFRLISLNIDKSQVCTQSIYIVFTDIITRVAGPGKDVPEPTRQKRPDPTPEKIPDPAHINYSESDP